MSRAQKHRLFCESPRPEPQDESWRDVVRLAFEAWQDLPALRSERWQRTSLRRYDDSHITSTTSGGATWNRERDTFVVTVRHGYWACDTLATLLHEMSHIRAMRLEDTPSTMHLEPWRETFLAAASQVVGQDLPSEIFLDPNSSIQKIDSYVEQVFRVCSRGGCGYWSLYLARADFVASKK